MRRKVFNCVICALMIATILMIEIPRDVSAQVTEEWVTIYNGPNNRSDGASDLAIGLSGNIYVTGESSTNGTGMGYDTIAYDPNGNLLWSARFKGSGNGHDEASAITTDSSENVYVTGSSYIATNHDDIVTVSYDSSGNKRWIAGYNGPVQYGNERAIAITTDSYGNVYVAGGSQGHRTDNYVTIKYDSFGNEVWVARYNGTETSTSHRAFAVAVDDLGNVYVSGEGWYGIWGGAVIKYNPFGNEMWVRTYDVGGVGGGQGLALDSSGNVYVSAGSTTFKYDTDGNVIWSAKYHGPGSGWLIGTGMAVDSLGNVFVSGYGKGLGAMDDYVTVKYDKDGKELWRASYDGPGNDYDRAYDMALDANGNVFVAGGSAGSNRFNDYATVAYDSNGNELWVARYNGPENQHDSITGIAIDSMGNIYVTGRSHGGPSHCNYATIKYSQNLPNEPPVADAGQDQTVFIDDIVQLIGSSSYDPDGSIVNYTWDLGDGKAGYGGVVSHIYHAPGEYKVNLTVTDDDGASDKDICIVTVLSKELTIRVDIDPNTLNLKSKGRWITCYISLNNPYDVNDIDISSIILVDTIPAERGDIQNDTLMVKFDRSEVEDMLSPGTYIMKVTGELTDGTSFKGYSDEIRVIEPP